MKYETNEQGGALVEVAAIMVFIFTIVFLVIMIIRATITKDMLDYLAVETSQCIKYGEKSVSYCIDDSADGLELFITPSKVNYDVHYYEKLQTYKQSEISHTKDSILVLTLSYDFVNDSSILNDLFPATLNLRSTATARIEQ